MNRSIAATLSIFLFALSVRANIPAFHAGADQKSPQPAAEARKKIIAEIDADSEHAIDRLNQRDPGAGTRARQQRILDNLDKLLNEQDPNPKGGNSQNPPPPKPMNPPPKPNVGDPGQKPAQAKEQSPQSPKPSVAKPAGNNKPGEIAKEIEKPNTQKELGPWPSGRPRDRQEMDAVARERLIRNYEELLRAYYRNIAERNRKEAD